MAKDDDTRISVIMPRELHQHLVALAMSDRRSLNSYLVLLLEAHSKEKSNAGA